MAATSKTEHSIWYKIFGAAKVVADHKKMQASVKGLLHGVRQLKAGMLGLRSYMTGASGSLVAFGLAMHRTVTAFADYSQAQARLRTTLAATTNAQRQNARISSVVAERAAIRLGYSTTEANDAMTTMIQTGIGVHASMRLIGSSLRLARIAEMDTDNATRFLVDTMNMFRREMVAEDLTLREFADSMSGKLAVAANMASTNIEQLQQAFRYAGTELSALGYTSSEVMSSLAGLSVVGLRGTTAGTRLRGAVAALTDPSQRVQREMDRLAGSTGAWRRILYDASGELLPLNQRMSNLMSLMGRARTDQERSQLEFAIFGRRAFAAGVSMSRFNEAARRMLVIHDEINDRGNVTNRVMRMEEERMRGFGMQVQQLKEGLDDLAIGFGEILFGAMENNRQGFGTYVREVARGIRLIGMLEDGHEDVRGQFEQLSPEVRESARRYREFFNSLATVVKALGWIAGKFMWLVTNFPRATGLVIALRVAFGGFIPLFSAVTSRLIPMVTQFRVLTPHIGAARAALAVFRPMIIAAGVEAIGQATLALVDYGIRINQWEQEVREARQTSVGMHEEWARQIPIIGSLVALYVRAIGLMQRLRELRVGVAHRRELKSREETRATAGERLQARYRTTTGRTQEERIARTISLERSSSVQRLATLLHGRGRTSRLGIQRTLEAGGMRGERLQETVQQIQRAQRSMGDLERANAQVLAGNRSLEEATLAASTQLAGFEGAMERFNDWVLANTGEAVGRSEPSILPNVSSPSDVNQSIPEAQDAYVNRGGLMGVSSGDIVVSRRHLANAVLARQGAMAGPAVSMAGEGMMAGPTPTVPGGGGGGTMNISIPVMLDGREIARAVGRANVTQLERGGGRLPPGQRRSLRETGFSRSV